MIASDNPCFRVIYRNCWSWGFHNPLKNNEGKYEGGPAPIYKSPNRGALVLFALANFVIFVIILIIYLNEAVIKGNTSMEFPGIFVAGLLLSGFNSTFPSLYYSIVVLVHFPDRRSK